MKTILYSIAALAAVIFAASCQQESLEVADGNIVTYSVKVPESLKTKANAEDYILNYEVYRAGEVSKSEASAVYEGTATFDAGTANFDLEFVKNQNFVVLFWAQTYELQSKLGTENQMFDIADLRKVQLLNCGASNNSNAAVFAGKDEVVNCVSSKGGEIKLVRPISQLNIFTTKASLDFGTKQIELLKSNVTVSGLYDVFNVATGAAVVTEETETVSFTYTEGDVPETGENDPHAYAAMNYVGFAAQNGTTVDVDFTIKTSEGDVSHSVSNVPVKPNYKTSIVGNLLTGKTDYNVTIDSNWGGILVSNVDDLMQAIKQSCTVVLTDDIQFFNTLDIKAGVDVVLDMNGKTLSVDADNFVPNSNGSQYAFIIREGGSLTIDGNGTIEISTPAPVFFYPAGDLVIENGTFIRHIPEEYNGNVGSMFVGTKPSGGWHSTGVTIKGGYFDCGYYDEVVEVVEAILSGDAELEETDTDISKRGQAGDTNKTRNAIKNLVSKALNLSNNYIDIKGGTFVGVNPAYGDEGCMLPTTPYYLRPWSYYQGGFIEDQKFNENGIVLPEGYTITKGKLDDDRLTFTVTYNK